MEHNSVISGSCLAYKPEEFGLIMQLFELRELFLEKGMIKFKPSGTCMYPCLKEGDTVYIEPRKVRQVNIGDIVVYRRCNRLYAHRAINKGEDKGLDYVVTRPDTSKFGDDGPTFDNDIVGIVSKVERNGKILDTKKKKLNFVEGYFVSFYFRWRSFKWYMLKKIASIMSYCQRYKIYRKIVEFIFWAFNFGKRIDFSILLPASVDGQSRFYKVASFEELVSLYGGSKSPAELCWKISLVFNKKPIASISFVFKDGDQEALGWWISEINMQLRHRLMCLEDRIGRYINEVLKGLNARQVFIKVNQGAYLDKIFLMNIGFKPDKKLQNSSDDIIMRKEIR